MVIKVDQKMFKFFLSCILRDVTVNVATFDLRLIVLENEFSFDYQFF